MKALVFLVVAGCALTSHTPARELRTFSPERPDDLAAHVPREPKASLRLGHVTASANLRYAILHRDSPYEVEPYETLRWTELPDAYVQRALAKALFEDRPLAEAVSGSVPTLDVELLAFEEVTSPSHARVVLRYTLHDDTTVLDHGTIAIERAAAAPQIEAVVAALHDALRAAASEIADRVEHALLERARPAPENRYAPNPARSDARASLGTRAPTLQ